MKKFQSIKSLGYSIRSPYHIILLLLLLGAPIFMLFTPKDGVWLMIRQLLSLLQMIGLGVVIAYNLPMWEYDEHKDKSKKESSNQEDSTKT